METLVSSIKQSTQQRKNKEREDPKGTNSVPKSFWLFRLFHLFCLSSFSFAIKFVGLGLYQLVLALTSHYHSLIPSHDPSLIGPKTNNPFPLLPHLSHPSLNNSSYTRSGPALRCNFQRPPPPPNLGIIKIDVCITMISQGWVFDKSLT
jgi:hypothetical protein